MRWSVVMSAVVLALVAPSPRASWAQAPAAQAVAVGTVLAARQPVTQGADFVGRVQAPQRVDIRARVKGFLEAVLFQEGGVVAEGDPLYRIEQPPFQAAVQQAQGALMQAQATYQNAAQQRARADELVKTSATSVATRDQRVADEQAAQGSVVTADADLRTAKINLQYTNITAPIAGRIGRSAVTKGNVVGPDSGVLVTIVSQDPMYVTFPVSQREFLRVQESGRKVDTSRLVVKVRFANGTLYAHPGTIDFVDVTVDRATDTVSVRATVPNPDGMLVDGQYVRVVVQDSTPEEKVTVPQAALIADQEGVYVFVVEDGKAVARRIKVGAEVGRAVVVDGGLKGGEQVIVQGLQGVRPGAPVLASPLPDSLGAG